MLDSQPHVDTNINAMLIVADGRHPQYQGMTDETPFQQRFRAAIAHLGAKSSTAFAKKLGVTENAGAVAYNWFNRDGKLPEAYRRPLTKLGISIDWLNNGEGRMAVDGNPPSESQLAGQTREIMRLAVRVIDHVRDMALEPIPPDRAEVLVDLAIEETAAAVSRESNPIVSDVARRVAARFRTGG